MYYIGIDIGGTFIKAGIINNNNEITHYESIKTSLAKTGDEFPNTLLELINKLLISSNLLLENFSGYSPSIAFPPSEYYSFSNNF